jgi:hypothetical protein
MMRFIPLIECFLSVVGYTLQLKSSSYDTKMKKTEKIVEVNIDHIFNPISTTSAAPPNSLYAIQDVLSRNNLYLLHFAEHNITLLNLILRNNIHLLETSFAPLILNAKCRSYLHFDVKRVYFKNKLKKLKATHHAAASAGAAAGGGGYLRLHVRRSHVFEESFQALRYKTAGEMRRRLNVMFHNEEGKAKG